MRPLLLAAASICLLAPLGAHLPEVQEQRLANGLRVLVVARPGTGAVHARWVVKGGTADAGTLPPLAAELLARCLFRPATPADLGAVADLEERLAAEEGAFEALRVARLGGAEGAARETEALEAHLRSTQTRLGAALAEPEEPYPSLEVGADHLSGGLALPTGDLPTWLQQESLRLRLLILPTFPEARSRLVEQLAEPGQSRRKALDVLFSAALPGQAYGRAAAASREGLESLGWAAFRNWARTLLTPDRLNLVLVGDVELPALRRDLEASLGSLPASPLPAEDRPLGVPGPGGARRIQASLPVEPQLVLGWRIPAASHPDHLALELLAQALAARLTERFQALDRPLVETVEVTCGVPGLRDPGLFLVRLRPARGQGLAALEEALRSELVRLQREAFAEEDLRRAQRCLEAAQLQVQEGASGLAAALGRALVQQGDWRRAFRFRALGRDLTPHEVQAVARTYLAQEQVTLALLEPDPLLAPQDPLEARLLEVLRQLVQRQVRDPAQADGIVREALRQLRMLTLAEREQTLRLLRSQVKP